MAHVKGNALSNKPLYEYMKTIDIEGVGAVIIRKSAKAKRLILKIDQSGSPIITLPRYVPYSVAERFGRQNSTWFQEHMPRIPKLVIKEGKRIGSNHTVKFTQANVSKPRSRVSKDTITVTIPFSSTTQDIAVQAETKKASIRALKQQAEATLPGLLHGLAQNYGYTYREVRIKTVQTRWGSCSSNNIINLSVWLMQLPEELVEYVLCHELTHLHHMHHQQSFWAELAHMVPDYKARKKQLKNFSPTLL